MVKPGKRTKEWTAARRKLKKIYLDHGVTSCEVGIAPDCGRNELLSFAHRYKRRDPRCEHTFEGTILCCIPCHMKIEGDKELTESYFIKLRP